LWRYETVRPFLMEAGELISARELVLSERAVLSEWLVPGHDVGLSGDWAKGLVRVRAGVFNGNGSILGDDNLGMLFAGTGRRVGALAKKELLKAPILGYGMGFVNVIAIDRSNRERAVETLKIAKDRLASGISFVVCAEGTRAKPGEMLPFKKGAFHLAVEAGVPIAPIALKNSDVLMGKGTHEAWPGTIEMVMLPTVDTSWVRTDEDLDQLVARVQSLIMNELGIEQLSKRPEKTTSAQNHK
jgi:1-acyl-sn-glycerol-3-phosphate acyltransferase